MLAKLESLERKFEDLEHELSQPEIFNDQERYRKVSKSHSDLKDVVEVFRKYREKKQELEDNKELVSDPDLGEMAREEIKEIETLLPQMEQELKVLLLPKDPMDHKNIMLEIRAGTGGEEAALFAGDLFRMYSRYAERAGWRVELLEASETGTGGFKEVIALIKGERVYSRLKFESGIHRVQRVPATETQGRIHTSAATVAIMPEAEEVDVNLRNEDLRFDVYRSSGPGGQSVNTTDSAVRVTHIPTGITVACQDEKSQHKNKAKALRILSSRILQVEEEKRHAELAEQRKEQVGSGDRSGRIRTYNFPQGRCTDHRINLTLYKLDAIMDGDISELTDALITNAQTEALKSQAEA